MDDLKNLNEDQQKQLLFMMLVQQHQQIGMNYQKNTIALMKKTHMTTHS